MSTSVPDAGMPSLTYPLSANPNCYQYTYYCFRNEEKAQEVQEEEGESYHPSRNGSQAIHPTPRPPVEPLPLRRLSQGRARAV